MKKTTTAGALLVAGVLALTACGGSAEGKDSTPAASSSPSKSAAPTTNPVGEDQYTEAELLDSLRAVNSEQGLGAKVISDAEIRPELAGAGDALAGVTITPAQCSVVASADVDELLDNVKIAMMVLSPTTVLTVFSHPDASVLETQVENDAKLLDECATYQMDAAGMAVTATNAGIAASTDAEVTQGFVTTTTGTGTMDTAVHVSGISGTTRVKMDVTAPEDPEAAVAEAEEIINAVLAELEKK